MSTPILAEGYTLHHTPPSVDSYLALRRCAPNLTPINASQATASLANSWHTVHITHSSSPEAIGMGRVISDSGWYFSVADIVVLPSHQRKGLGDFIMATLMGQIKERAPKGPPGAYVNLFAAPGARKLYGKYGFKDSMPASMGMALWLEKE